MQPLAEVTTNRATAGPLATDHRHPCDPSPHRLKRGFVSEAADAHEVEGGEDAVGHLAVLPSVRCILCVVGV